MLFRTLLTALLALSFSALAAPATETKPASQGESSLNIKEVTGQKNKVDGDIDQEITNAKLRAESGSKSKFSLSMKADYTGGSVKKPFGTQRPSLAADPSTQKFTSFDLGLNARYRWTKNDSMMLGTKFGFVTPFQGRVTKNDAMNVNDPSISYSRVGKVFNLQTVGTVSYAYGTSINSRSADITHQLGLAYNMMKSFGKLSAGASVGFGYYKFSNRPGENAGNVWNQYGGDRRVEWSLGLFPQAEYAFSDKLSARTVFGYFNWLHRYGDPNRFRMLQNYVYQSVGIGWAVTRDFYLYPNVQFVPDNIRSDFTNVALNATINVF